MKIAFIANTIIPRDAIGKYSLQIFDVLRNKAEVDVYLEKKNQSTILKKNSREWYFFKGCPPLLWYFVEWKLGRRFRGVDKLLVDPIRKIYFRKLARRFADYDIVWLQFGLYFNGIYLLEALQKLDKRPRIIFDYHGITPNKYIEAKGKSMIAKRSREDVHRAANVANICLVRSRYMADELSSLSQPNEVLKVPLSVEIPKKVIARSLGGATKLLFVGRIATHKNIKVILEAVSLLKKSGKEVNLRIAGSFGRSSLAMEKQRLESLVDKFEINKNVKFLGEVDDERLAELYRTSDMLIVPSFHEGFSWPVIEAMQFGLPVIASQAGALPETVGSAGLLFDPGDPEQLARQIKNLANNQQLRDKLVEAGFSHIKQFSSAKFKQKINSIVFSS